MKKIKTLLILSSMLLIGFAVQSQTPSITYRFNNYMVVPGAVNDTLIFDVEAKSNVNTTYTTTFTIKINFNAAVFGTSAIPVSVQQLALSLPTGYNLNTPAASAGPSRFASTFLAYRLMAPHNGTYQTAYLSNLTTTYQGVARYKMLIMAPGNAGIEFVMSGAGSMQSGNNYVLTSGGTITMLYNPITAANNLLTLPSDIYGTSLMISEVGDPSNSSTNFVELYNYGSLAVNLGAYAWNLNVDGSSAIPLTGTVAPGAKFTVGYDAVDFTPSLVSTLVGTGGASSYQLTMFGDYANGGTLTDVYDATVTGYSYTGKHAVRHYNISAGNTTFTGSEWVVSAAENIDMTPGSHGSTLTWDGVPGSEWRAKNNWGEGFIPDAGHNVSIPNVGADPVISFGDNAFSHDLNITGGAVLTIESTPGNDGSLITYGTVTGSASVQRYLGADRYWYVTQPVTSATADVFLHMWLFTYSGNAWSPFIYDETTPLNIMKGYAVWTSSINSYDPEVPPLGSVTTSYDGTLVTGNQSTGLTSGWNFTGNPYVSAVDWEAAGWTKTNLVTNAYSVWDGATYGTYIAGSGGTNGTTKYIPAAQGFFVEASAAGTLGVTNAVRAHDALDFWKSEANMENRLSMTISNGTIDDETVIFFYEAASTELDYSFDARKMMAESAPQAYTMLGEDKMAINAFNNTTQTNSVILGVNIPADGNYTLTASNLESFDVSVPVYLEDLVTGEKVNLRETAVYTFSAVAGTTERFVVHFTTLQGIGDDASASINSIYAIDKIVYVDFNDVKGEVVIYDILGQEVKRVAAVNGINTIPVSKGNAVYIVKVISENTTVTKKVFVK